MNELPRLVALGLPGSIVEAVSAVVLASCYLRQAAARACEGRTLARAHAIFLLRRSAIKINFMVTLRAWVSFILFEFQVRAWAYRQSVSIAPEPDK